MNFAEVEKQFVRDKAYPKFDWLVYDQPSRINPLSQPLAQSRVAMVTTCGAHLESQPAFNLRSPAGDPSYRVIPGDTRLNDLVLSHVGYNTKVVSQDKNSVFPLDRLRELEKEGVVGSLSTRHFSFMGYVAEAGQLLEESAPAVAEKLREDRVGLVILAPA